MSLPGVLAELYEHVPRRNNGPALIGNNNDAPKVHVKCNLCHHTFASTLRRMLDHSLRQGTANKKCTFFFMALTITQTADLTEQLATRDAELGSTT